MKHIKKCSGSQQAIYSARSQMPGFSSTPRQNDPGSVQIGRACPQQPIVTKEAGQISDMACTINQIVDETYKIVTLVKIVPGRRQKTPF